LASDLKAIPAEILEGIKAYHPDGDVIEIRCPTAKIRGYKAVLAGYFDDYEAAAREAANLSDKQGVPAVYITLNRINPNLLAKYYNRIESRADKTTSDNDVISLEWFPIDIDAERLADISSTDQEHDAAIARAQEVRQWLIEEIGWPKNAFVLGDSGNGGHSNAKIESLENTQENRDLIKRGLDALNLKFPDDGEKVDVSTGNPSRVWKLPGTAVKKGDDTPNRPHRKAKILERPEVLELVSKALLEKLAALAPKDAPKDTASQIGNASKAGTSGFDPAKYAELHGAKVIKVKSGWLDPKGRKWTLAILEQCPFNPQHNRGEAWVGVAENGMRGFSCPHDGCKGNDWQALKKKWEGDDSQKGQKDSSPTVIDAIKVMAGVCDGACSKDGTGFNKKALRYFLWVTSRYRSRFLAAHWPAMSLIRGN